MTDKKDNNKFSDALIAVCAVNATRRTDGVAEMAGGISDVINRGLGREISAKGVKVNQLEDNEIEVDVYIIAQYGCQIPLVAWDIQENVKKEIQYMTGLDVQAVNIHVQGVKADDKN